MPDEKLRNIGTTIPKIIQLLSIT